MASLVVVANVTLCETVAVAVASLVEVEVEVMSRLVGPLVGVFSISTMVCCEKNTGKGMGDFSNSPPPIGSAPILSKNCSGVFGSKCNRKEFYAILATNINKEDVPYPKEF